MTCKHEHITTFVFADTKEPSGLWACASCKKRFEPIKLWVGLTDDEVVECYSDDFLTVWTNIEGKLKEKNA